MLIVEDEEACLETLVEYFTVKGFGFQIDTALTLQEGLSELDSFKPQILLMDMLLKEIDATPIIHKAIKLSPKPEVIVMTGLVASEVAWDLRPLGVKYVIQKPMRLTHLVSALEEVTKKLQENEK